MHHVNLDETPWVGAYETPLFDIRVLSDEYRRLSDSFSHGRQLGYSCEYLT